MNRSSVRSAWLAALLLLAPAAARADFYSNWSFTWSFNPVPPNAPGLPPVIRPVNYVYDDRTRSVIFRSARGTKLTALLLAQRAAFEIDGVEPSGDVGWSVIVSGRVQEINHPAELARLRRMHLRPFVSDDLPHKSEHGLVSVGLADETALMRAWDVLEA